MAPRLPSGHGIPNSSSKNRGPTSDGDRPENSRVRRELAVKVVVGEILPLALVVTISPINVIPVILLLFTKRPLVNASSFFVGFAAGVAGILVALVAIAEAVDLSPGSGHSTWVAVLKLGLGAYLLVAAIRKFRGRPRHGEEGTMPKWMDGIAGFRPRRSLGTGLALGSLNPKNVAVGLAAAATIASV